MMIIFCRLGPSCRSGYTGKGEGGLVEGTPGFIPDATNPKLENTMEFSSKEFGKFFKYFFNSAKRSADVGFFASWLGFVQ